MKVKYSKICGMMAALVLVAGMQSCSLEAPFGDGGEGTLVINTEIRGEVTKTRTQPENITELEENLMVYIENSRGVMRKYKGKSNIPESIALSAGSYVCNAWSGDSVPASYTQKFYRGQQAFEIIENQSTPLEVKCNIANVVVSVNPEALNIGLSDMKVKFSTTRGELTFDESQIQGGVKGYFMTPDPATKNADPEKYAKNTVVTVALEGKKSDGSAFTKTYEIKDVKRAHEYEISLTKDQSTVTQGGALIQLVIKDIPIIEESVEVFTAPVIKGVGFDIEDQVVNTTKTFDMVSVMAYAYGSMTSLILESNYDLGLGENKNIIDAAVQTALSEKGIHIHKNDKEDDSNDSGKVKVEEYTIHFETRFLNEILPDSKTEYTFTFTATDASHKVSTKTLHIANTESAITKIDDAVSDPAPDPETNPMAVLATKATLTGTLYNRDATDYGYMYRKSGAVEWTKAAAAGASNMRRSTRATGVPFTVTLTGLEAGTAYEYKAYAGDFVSADVRTFTTEAKFDIPNASMEEWNTYKNGSKNIVIPWSVGDKEVSFWGTGNEGASLANATLTDKSTDMKHSGTYSSRLETKVIVGKVAAGNIFVGKFVKIDGTNGILAMGSPDVTPFNGSHPTKLRVWMNYRPGNAVKIGKDSDPNIVEVTENGTDHGQIYVALTDGVQEIRTKPSNQKLFEPNGDYVLAYGERTWKENFGADGQLEMVEIPFVYNERANTKRPTCIVITCCASKYGDYFSGSEGSVMYVDDFELVYE